MKCNVGKFDSVIRVMLGIALMVLGVQYQSLVGWAGVFIFLTAFIHWCPIYKMAGFNSSRNVNGHS